MCSSPLALLLAATGYRCRVLMNGAQKAFGIAVCAAALSGCGSSPATTATETVTVTMTPPPISAVIPLELPKGSVVYSRYVNEHNGAWVDMWAVPFAGPDAMTETEIIGYLQSRLPVGARMTLRVLTSIGVVAAGTTGHGRSRRARIPTSQT